MRLPETVTVVMVACSTARVTIDRSATVAADRREGERVMARRSVTPSTARRAALRLSAPIRVSSRLDVHVHLIGPVVGSNTIEGDLPCAAAAEMSDCICKRVRLTPASIHGGCRYRVTRPLCNTSLSTASVRRPLTIPGNESTPVVASKSKVAADWPLAHGHPTAPITKSMHATNLFIRIVNESFPTPRARTPCSLNAVATIDSAILPVKLPLMTIDQYLR